MLAKRRAIAAERRWSQIIPMMEHTDRNAIACALRLAAEQYRKDAASCVAAGVQRSVDGFTAQAEHAELLAEIIEL